jgi:Spy/CpxP family protein refolding chaperone
MKKRTWIPAVVIVVLLAILAVPLVNAQGRHRARGDMALTALGRLERAREVLGLTDQQVSQIRTIAADLRSQNAPYRTQVRGSLATVAQALVANPDDLAGAQALLDQQAGAEQAIRHNTLTAAAKALGVLTPDQRAKVGTFIARRQSSGHEEPF